MKGELTLKILELIEEGITTTIDLTSSFLKAGYGASADKLNYEFEKRHFKRESAIGKFREFFKEREKLYKLIYKLEQDELIRKSNKKGKWLMTVKGKEKRLLLRKRLNKNFPSRKYHRSKSSRLKIIIFDIPEKERDKRDWLRLTLRLLGFKMLQKSVWTGSVEIPRTFIEDLSNLKLLSCVEIFEISKTGTLKPII